MVNYLLFTLCTLVSMPIMGMEMPSHPVMEYYNPATLIGLPADVKAHIFSFLASGDIVEMERQILILGATNKQLLNSPTVILAIINAVAKKVRYTAYAVQLAQRLQTRTKTLPVMQDPAIGAWLAKTKSSLQDGAKMYQLISEGPRQGEIFTSPIKECLLNDWLENRQIDLDWQHPTEQYKTALMWACHDNKTNIAFLLLAIGASIDWRTNCTVAQLNTLEANCPLMKIKIDNAFAARKKQLALKQPRIQ